MKIKCLHGFFLFQETSPGQVSDFIRLFGLSLVAYGDKFTFSDLQSAPSYSLATKSFMGYLPAVTTFEGKPWEVFQANGFVYNFVSGLVVPILSVTQNAQLSIAGNQYVSNGLLLPGSLTDSGDIIKSYSGWFSRQTQSFIYSEVSVG